MNLILIALNILSLTALMVSTTKDGCYYGKTSWPVGESFSPIGECSILNCESKGTFTAKTCPTEEAIGCKYIPQDNSKPFPACCPNYKCSEKQ